MGKLSKFSELRDGSKKFTNKKLTYLLCLLSAQDAKHTKSSRLGRLQIFMFHLGRFVTSDHKLMRQSLYSRTKHFGEKLRDVFPHQDT